MSSRFRPLRVWRTLPWLAALVACSVLIVLGEISGLLARLQETGAESYSAGALTGWPGSPPWAARGLADAITFWSEATGDPELRRQVLGWLHLYLWLDGLFILAYCTLLWFAVRAAVPESDLPPRRVWAIILVVAVLDGAETASTWFVIGGLTRPPDGFLLGFAGTMSALKWLAIAYTAGVILLSWLRPDTEPAPPLRGDRIVRRHRVQVLVVAILLLVLVAPLGGGLDQGPDVVRAWADGKCAEMATPSGQWCVNLPLRKIAGPTVGST